MSTRMARVDWNEARRRLESAEQALNGSLAWDQARVEVIYRRRAALLAGRRDDGVADDGKAAVLMFRLGSERYGLPLLDVTEALPAPPVTPVPRSPAHLSGLASVRGEIRTVVDLTRLLGLPPPTEPPRSLVMLRCEDRELGLLVDGVDGVEAVPDYAAESGAVVAAVTPDLLHVLNPVELRRRLAVAP
jgi:purine-binding chemotaxis protein CheW